MMEPFFGSPNPLWPGNTPPIFGWPSAMPFTNRPAPSGAPLTSPVQLRGPEPPPLSSLFGAPATLPAFSGSEVPVPPTAGAIATYIAMRRGQPAGPTTDPEIEDFLYDALELVSGAGEVDVRSENGRVTLSGNVPHKRQKRDVGEIAWVIPSVNDVQNTLTIVTRRRTRASRDADAHQPASTRKPA